MLAAFEARDQYALRVVVWSRCNVHYGLCWEDMKHESAVEDYANELIAKRAAGDQNFEMTPHYGAPRSRSRLPKIE